MSFQAAARRKTSFIDRLRHYFAGPVFVHRLKRATRQAGSPRAQRASPKEGIFVQQARQFTKAQVIVRCFYAFGLYLAITECPAFPILVGRADFVPLWPVSWMSLRPDLRTSGIGVLLASYALASGLGALFAQHRWVRVCSFVGVLEYFSFRNSFGKIGHSTHLFVTVSFILLFLPAGWHRPAAFTARRARQETLSTFWLCQAAVLLSYTMSGLGKLGGAIYQIAAGQPSAFSPGALGTYIATRLLQTHSRSLLGSLIIDHPYLTWPMMPLPIYLELFAFWMAFRPALQRWWALALILFHVGTIFTLTITFPIACLLLALFFFDSPFQPVSTRWREALSSLPLFGDLLRF